MENDLEVLVHIRKTRKMILEFSFSNILWVDPLTLEWCNWCQWIEAAAQESQTYVATSMLTP